MDKRAPKLAFLWIDDPKNNHAVTHGYLCTEDQPNEVVKTRLADLPFEYTYVTNLKSHRFKNLGIRTQYGIKHANYFGVAAGQIAMELGVSDTLSEKLSVFTIVLSQLAQRIFNMYGVAIKDESWTILEGLRDKIYPNLAHQTLRLNGCESDALGMAIENSLQKLQANTVFNRSPNKFNVISAKYPKTPYFFHLLQQNYPISENYKDERRFEGVKIGRSGSVVNGEEHIQQLIEYAKSNAGFFNFHVDYMDSKHQRYVPLGQEIKTCARREWAALPEIIDLCNYATITLGIGYVTKAEKLPFAPEAPTSDVVFLSYVNGTVNEALLWSLSYKKEQERYTSPIAAYIRAYDRVIMRQVAMSIVDEGFDTLGFSNGTVRFVARSAQERESLRVAMTKKGLVPQLKHNY
ncbi:hypothetical protein M2G93_16825 [Vibrio vulnificus]|uniref:hypothetical protein n=1 Tax=Vibrio vulnificus TaxID=672 RepID=UPI0021DAACC8|nr:hypothetical protein [Vibrio vulnificus]EHD1698112.1 hypothetical protein [Vibrio vulnificus]EKZ9225841.1 hypothetical protein [Vibrio vulnificus]ELC9582683.1 hypothetical protein [Vibrio vulnificus]MCU8149780.1 hypothetical protein [Vibrio vulnificus]